jgi:hypothetical protein
MTTCNGEGKKGNRVIREIARNGSGFSTSRPIGRTPGGNLRVDQAKSGKTLKGKEV